MILKVSNLVIINILVSSCVLGLPCTYPPNHTMCKYRPKACRRGLLENEISLVERATILEIHNQLRAKVANGQQTGQPSATNMRELKWDEELATIAQRWADQCTIGHDAHRETTKYKTVGQNLFISLELKETKGSNFSQAINAWYNELQRKPAFIPLFIPFYIWNPFVLRYTQVVWAETDRIGCGYAFTKNLLTYEKHYVCNYGPGGNTLGASIYKVGPAATACAAGKSSAYPGLCDS